MRPIRLKKNRHSDRFMFTDKRHSKRGIFSCVLGVSGLAACIYSIVRMAMADGAVTRAQTFTFALAVLYALAGLTLGIWMLARGDTFRLFPGIGVALNLILLLGLGALLFLGLT